MNGDPTDDPDLKALTETVNEVMRTALTALDKGYSMPALILVYTLIDTFGWLSSKKKETVAQRFERFADEWVMVNRKWDCSAKDLYAARCATLHQMTGDSDLSKNGSAKRLLYVFGSLDTNILDDHIDQSVVETFGRININQLVSAVGEAAGRYIFQVYKDESHLDEFKLRARRYYIRCNID